MKDERNVKPTETQAPAAEGHAEAPAPRRRPFAPPVVQELGELKELTREFGTSGL